MSINNIKSANQEFFQKKWKGIVLEENKSKVKGNKINEKRKREGDSIENRERKSKRKELFFLLICWKEERICKRREWDWEIKRKEIGENW